MREEVALESEFAVRAAPASNVAPEFGILMKADGTGGTTNTPGVSKPAGG